MNELSMIDLFAGAGGLSQGLREAGFRSLYANELVPVYAKTYATNHPETWIDSRDVREVNAQIIRRTLDLEKGELDLVAGGPPCQGFSINAPKRSSEDKRNHLFREFLRFVEEFEPRAVLIENVPGLVSFDRGNTLASIFSALGELGYRADVRILYAPHFGVPQTRWRTVVLGVREGNPADAFPTASRSAPVRVNFTSRFDGRDIVGPPATISMPLHTTVSEALDDLPVLANGESGMETKAYRVPPQNAYQAALRTGSQGVTSHEAPRLGHKNLERIRFIPPGGNWTSIPIDLLPLGMQRARRSDHTKRYGRVTPDGLASTILTKCDPHWGAYIHYGQDRTFTVREAARIQSFPDHYFFTGSRAEQYEQVGNAVPPLLAAAIGLSLGAALGHIQPAINMGL